jgi:hypothetical protein
MPEVAPSTPTPSPPPAAPVPLVQSSPSETPAQRLWQNQQNEITRADPWKNPDQLITRDRDGVVSASPRSDPAAQPGAQPPVGDASVENGHLKVGDLTLSPDEVKGLLERHALESSRKATAPTRAEDFKLELPADLKMPEGVTFQFNPNDPAIEPARQFALRNNLSQQQFSEMVGVYVAAQANEMVAFNTAKAAEVAKLGDAANARVDAVTGWLKAMGGNHFGALAKVLQLAPVADTVVGLEHLMHRYVTQGGGAFNGAHREPHIPGKISDALPTWQNKKGKKLFSTPGCKSHYSAFQDGY